MADKGRPQGSAKLEATPFLIVGIGSSAGGIEAVGQLLRNLPANLGIAFVIIQHLDPARGGNLTHVLSRTSKLPLELIESDTRVEMNRVYVAPGDRNVTLHHGVLRLEEREHAAATLSIDHFFRSLAEEQKERAIGVILSGAMSDGTLGSKAIKGGGGITFAQDDTAQFSAMPRNAVISGAIDFVLPPNEIAHELVRLSHHEYMAEEVDRSEFDRRDLARLFAHVQRAHDVDFTNYKPSTIERRIRRRMAVRKAETLKNYLTVIANDPAEIEELYADMLIRVTGFFRDPAVFETLQKEVLPQMMQARDAENPLRLWVPGCATGEEVYSLAMSALEVASESGFTCQVQIFGTDISDAAIERARAGVYPETITTELSAERLRRYFVKVDNSYRINKSVRDCCIFARQNLTKDPPFSNIDIISCRNVMIYLGVALQKRVLSIFHYALRPNGYLVLGTSESIGNFADLFSPADRRHKIYQKKSSVGRAAAMKFAAQPVRQQNERIAMEEHGGIQPNVLREADRVALARYVPPGVVVNEQLEILQFRGRTSPYLEPAPGTASFNLLKMVREGLLAELRAAIQASRKSEAPVRREGARIKSDGVVREVAIEVVPILTGSGERFHLILFQEGKVERAKGKGRKKEKPTTKVQGTDVARMKKELEATREYLQSIIEEQEGMNDELRSANEEIQSSNEELQSTNEELETAKEELQSSNEELTTLNEELEKRNDELAEVNSDLQNLLTSVDLPILMLDQNQRIRRFNPGAQRSLNLIAADVGRSINDLKTIVNIDDLNRQIALVLEDLTVRETGVQDREGRWYSLRIRPYKTIDNKISGVVLVLIDIEQLARAGAKK